MKVQSYSVDAGAGLGTFEIARVYRDGEQWVSRTNSVVVRSGTLEECLASTRARLHEAHYEKLQAAKKLLIEADETRSKIEAVRAKIDAETQLPPEAPCDPK